MIVFYINCQHCGGKALPGTDHYDKGHVLCTRCGERHDKRWWDQTMRRQRASNVFTFIERTLQGGQPVSVGVIKTLLDNLYGEVK